MHREALLSVAKTFFENVDLGAESIKVSEKNLYNHLFSIYLIVRVK